MLYLVILVLWYNLKGIIMGPYIRHWLKYIDTQYINYVIIIIFETYFINILTFKTVTGVTGNDERQQTCVNILLAYNKLVVYARVKQIYIYTKPHVTKWAVLYARAQYCIGFFFQLKISQCYKKKAAIHALHLHITHTLYVCIESF